MYIPLQGVIRSLPPGTRTRRKLEDISSLHVVSFFNSPRNSIIIYIYIHINKLAIQHISTIFNGNTFPNPPFFLRQISGVVYHYTHKYLYTRCIYIPLKEESPPEFASSFIHGENGGTLGMVPLIINPIYTLYSGYLLGFIGYIPRVPPFFL